MKNEDVLRSHGQGVSEIEETGEIEALFMATSGNAQKSKAKKKLSIEMNLKDHGMKV